MRIVYISQAAIPSRTANSIHVMKMCHAFAANGHELTLIVPDSGREIERGIADPFEYYGVSRNFEISVAPWIRLKGRGYYFGLIAAREAKLIGPELVYGRNIAGCYFSACLGLPVIFESHAPVADAGAVPHGIFSRLIRKSVFKKLVVITEALRTYYTSRWRNLVERIQVLPDGADPVAKGTQPVNLGGRPNHLQVVYVGHLYRGRGIDLLVSLARRLPRVDFHFVGGSETDIQHWMRESDGTHNVSFHGFVPPSRADAYRLAADVLVAPYQLAVSVAGGGGSNTAPWMSPLKIFEYMAAGKAIVASDLPALKEVLRHKDNALLCPPDDVDAWVDAIVMLEASSDLRRHMGSKGRSELETGYSWVSRARAALL